MWSVDPLKVTVSMLYLAVPSRTCLSIYPSAENGLNLNLTAFTVYFGPVQEFAHIRSQIPNFTL